MIEGLQTAELVQAVTGQFKISSRMAFKDIAEIHRRWRTLGRTYAMKKNSQASLALAIKRRHDQYQKAMLAGDIRTALAVDSDRCKLEGLYPKEKSIHRHTGGDGGPVQTAVVHYYIPENGRDKPEVELAFERNGDPTAADSPRVSG